MKIELNRRFLGSDYTIGTLSVDGARFCDTLEDTVRDLAARGYAAKVPGQTAIPFGTYPVIVNVSPKFGRELPRLLDVPFFEGILIHRGNTAADSAGCILVGENREKGRVLNSTPYEVALVAKIKEAIRRGERVTIEIK